MSLASKCVLMCKAAPRELLVWLVSQDATSVTAADELSSSVSEDTGFCSAPPLPSDPQELCELHNSQEPAESHDSHEPADAQEPPENEELQELEESQDPPENLDPAPPPPLAIDTPPGSLCEEEEAQTVMPLSLPLPLALPPDPDPDPDSTCGSVWEEDVTQALKELDERCEEEEADFSGMSR